jgi:hypothetical protein
MSKSFSKKEIRSLTDLIKKHSHKLAYQHKIRGTGIGFKISRGQITDEIALIAYVRYKPGINTLRQNNTAPLPREIDGLKTDVVSIPTGFTTRILRRLDEDVIPDDGRYRPISGGEAMIMGGVSATGTLAIILKSNEELYGITNNHVGANEFVEGQPPTAEEGDDWIQPGYHGGGQDPQDAFAKLFKWNSLKPQGTGENYYDFSMAKVTINAEEVHPYKIKDIGQVEGIEDIELGQTVMKYGRTTRRTVGRVIAVGVQTPPITYGEQNIPCDFLDQVTIAGDPDPSQNPFSQPGDSGSAVVSTEGPPYKLKALFFAGGPDPSTNIDYSIASPFQRIATDFQLEV